jgi:putative flippase GtrA
VKPARRHTTARQVVLFGMVGGLSAIIDAGVFWLLTTWGVPPALATVISFLSAFAVNYRGNKNLVFQAHQSKGALVRYSILVVVNLGLSAGSVALGVAIGWPPLVAKVVSMVFVALVNFGAMRLWVFRRSPSASRPAPSVPSG